MNNKTKIKWYTELEIVDTETGELITKSEYERRDLIIIKKTKKNEYNAKSNAGITRWTWECGRNPQQKLW